MHQVLGAHERGAEPQARKWRSQSAHRQWGGKDTELWGLGTVTRCAPEENCIEKQAQFSKGGSQDGARQGGRSREQFPMQIPET